MKVSAGALMDKETARHLHAHYRLLNPGAVREVDAFNDWRARGLHGVFTSLPNQSFRSIEPIDGNPQHLARLVVHPKQQHAPATVGKGRQFIGKVVLRGPTNPAPREPKLLQLQEAVFTEPDLLQQLAGAS